MAGLIGFTPSENIRRAMTRTPQVRTETRRVAVKVRNEARRRAPKRTGAGAKSIRVSSKIVDGAQQFQVSWDRDHFYMAFHEQGASGVRKRPFLKPAADSIVSCTDSTSLI